MSESMAAGGRFCDRIINDGRHQCRLPKGHAGDCYPHINAPRPAARPGGEGTPEPWVVWSFEHDAWWRSEHAGYAADLLLAGIYTEAEAREIEDNANYPGHRKERALSLTDALRERDSLLFRRSGKTVAGYLLEARSPAPASGAPGEEGCPKCAAVVAALQELEQWPDLPHVHVGFKHAGPGRPPEKWVVPPTVLEGLYEAIAEHVERMLPFGVEAVKSHHEIASLRTRLAAAEREVVTLREDAERWRVWVANLPARETIYIGHECSRYTVTLAGRMTIPEWVDGIRHPRAALTPTAPSPDAAPKED